MDKLTITKTGCHKEADISIPSSKSYIHRYLLAALLSEGESTIENVTFSNDIKATLGCIENLGGKVNVSDGGKTIIIKGGLKKLNSVSLYCGESASTMRFIIPVAMLFSNRVTVTGEKTLMQRPLEPYFDIFRKNGVTFDYKSGEYLMVCGSLAEKEYVINGAVSSQFVTGLLFSLPLMNFDSTVKIGGTLQSKPYVDITLEVLKNSGIEIINNDYRSFFIKGNQKYTAGKFFTQGDYSQAAFFLTAGCFLGGISVSNMEPDSLQGDKVIVDILRKMGADIKSAEKGYIVEKSDLKSPGVIDATDFPDIVPILSLACALSEGKTVIKGIHRLRIKECDRVRATYDVLKRLGADISVENETIIISGKPYLSGGTVSSFNDHRMAMTAAVASLVCDNSVIILEPMSINKSYPGFYDDLLTTGGVKYEWSMGK